MVAAFGASASVPSGYETEHCFSCLGEISLLFRSVYMPEYMICPGLTRCEGDGQYVSADGQKCVQCPAGAFATSKRDGCLMCNAGTYQVGNGCQACDTNLELCPYSGMTAPLTQVMSCGAGLMLKVSGNSLVANTCETCQLCGEGTPYIFAEGHNLSNPCEQAGSQGGGPVHYFACYSSSDVTSQFSNPLNPVFSNLKYRLTFSQGSDGYDLNQNRVIVQACDDRSFLSLWLLCSWESVTLGDDAQVAAFQCRVGRGRAAMRVRVQIRVGPTCEQCVEGQDPGDHLQWDEGGPVQLFPGA